jgi:hypothetical protein
MAKDQTERSQSCRLTGFAGYFNTNSWNDFTIDLGAGKVRLSVRRMYEIKPIDNSQDMLMIDPMWSDLSEYLSFKLSFLAREKSAKTFKNACFTKDEKECNVLDWSQCY